MRADAVCKFQQLFLRLTTNGAATTMPDGAAKSGGPNESAEKPIFARRDVASNVSTVCLPL